jgi:hypothetical protein
MSKRAIIRNYIIIFLLLAVAAIASDFAHPRNVEVLSFTDIGDNMQVRRIHDNESGAEFLCFSRSQVTIGGPNGYAMSCVATGRKWDTGK